MLGSRSYSCCRYPWTASATATLAVETAAIGHSAHNPSVSSYKICLLVLLHMGCKETLSETVFGRPLNPRGRDLTLPGDNLLLKKSHQSQFIQT